MHGLIFLQLQKFTQQQGGTQAWEALLREAMLARKSYAPVRTYPDAEAFALVAAAGRLLKQTPAAVMEAFGEFLAPELIRLFGRLIDPAWKTLDVIENTERLIHAAVRVGNPGAMPPELQCFRTTEDELQIIYSSERQMCRLATGIIKGLARHYGETVIVSDQACMLHGDPICAFQATRLPPRASEEDTEIRQQRDSTPFSGTPTGLSNAREVLALLKPPLQADELGRLAEYRVLQAIGEGGMGIVFRAEDTRLSREVALKVMQPRFANDAGMRQRFLREARAMAAVHNDHIVTIYEVSIANDLPFLVMEFLEGQTLEAYQKALGRLPLAQCVRIGKETAQGLASAHARGLIHRDIKPANLWLEAPTGRVKILDFGLARLNTEAVPPTQVGLFVGTPGFIAPEQAQGEPVDYHADLFSLGCLLYWLCTNELPFQGKDSLSSVMALVTQNPKPPQTVAADVPAVLSDLIMQLLDKDPTTRMGPSRAVAEALADIEARHLFAAAGS